MLGAKNCALAFLVVIASACHDHAKMGPPSQPTADAAMIARDAAEGSDLTDATAAVDAGAAQRPTTMPLPAMPVLETARALCWFSIPGVASVTRVRQRGEVAYVAASPDPLRIDLAAGTYEGLAHPSGGMLLTQDIVAPPGAERLVAVFASTSGATLIRVSNDDGASWSDATGPAAPSSVTSAIPSTLASLPDTRAALGRTFMTYGGTTLDVSDDGGATWTRAISGGATVAVGFAIDRDASTLWLVAEAAIDRVAAFALDLGAVMVASDWRTNVLTNWDGNGVYSAEADPFDPHALYIGGEGRLGYLTPGAEGATVAVTWSAQPGGGPYTYVGAISPSPTREASVIFGGGEQGASDARVFESTTRGAAATEIPLDGMPSGSVRSILRSGSLVLIFVDTGATLDGYVIMRDTNG